MSSAKSKWGIDMQVGDLVKNMHDQSGFYGEIGLISAVVGDNSTGILLKVIWEGQEFLWIGRDCEVINGSR